MHGRDLTFALTGQFIPARRTPIERRLRSVCARMMNRLELKKGEQAMRKRKSTRANHSRKQRRTGREARAGRRILRSEKIGALPILNHFLQRLRLEEWLREHLPPEDKRVKVPAAKALLVLLRNLLVSREPLYGIGQWAAGYAPDLLGLMPDELEALSDDGVGRALGCLFRSLLGAFVLRVVRHTIREFDVSLQQLHNDSTTITFHGKYADAAEEDLRGGRRTLAITWGHNKDQPVIEKRFSQLKSDFRVAPVYLKEVSRIRALLCVYFLVLLVEALLERELRQAMQRENLDSLPLYPEERPCRRPTARRVIDLFDDIHRHTLHSSKRTPTVFVTELTDLQRRILKLLGIPTTDYRG